MIVFESTGDDLSYELRNAIGDLVKTRKNYSASVSIDPGKRLRTSVDGDSAFAYIVWWSNVMSLVFHKLINHPELSQMEPFNSSPSLKVAKVVEKEYIRFTAYYKHNSKNFSQLELGELLISRRQDNMYRIDQTSWSFLEQMIEFITDASELSLEEFMVKYGDDPTVRVAPNTSIEVDGKSIYYDE